MATLRRESPTLHTCSTENDAIVDIRHLIYTYDDQTSLRESQDGVKMTLMHRSLMFHLNALDMQFTQNTNRLRRAKKCLLAAGVGLMKIAPAI